MGHSGLEEVNFFFVLVQTPVTADYRALISLGSDTVKKKFLTHDPDRIRTQDLFKYIYVCNT